ncbi:MAG: hypothetical protein KGJ86_01955 [Chloroflexota bacterium]|nr:hypothetical protein [Chloroflexota bacterium]
MGLTGLVLAAGLAVAETGWLASRIPQDKPTRVALVAFPSPKASTGGQASLPGDWPTRLVSEADRAGVRQAAADKLVSRPAAPSHALNADELASRMRLGSSCIEIQPLTPGAKTIRGVLLYNVVRGADEAQTAQIAHAWSAAVTEGAAGLFPGLTIEPVESLGAPYEMCQ